MNAYTSRAIAIVLLSLLAVQSVASMVMFNASSDEIAHLAAGYTSLRTGDLSLNPEHPPLVKYLAAAPLLFMPITLAIQNVKDAPKSRQWELGKELLEHNDAGQILLWARLPNVCLALLLGVVVYKWSRRISGEQGAVLSLALYSFCPTIIAHSHFVTMDIAVSCFFVLSLYLLKLFVDEHRLSRALWCGVATGLCLGSKFSGLLLLVAQVVLLGSTLLTCHPRGRVPVL